MRLLYVMLFFSFLLLACSSVKIKRKNAIPYLPAYIINDTAFAIKGNKIGKVWFEKGEIKEEWKVMIGSAGCYWARGLIYDMEKNTIYGYFTNDKSEKRILGDYYGCGVIKVYSIYEDKDTLFPKYKGDIDLKACGWIGPFPLYQSKYLVIPPKWANVLLYAKGGNNYAPVAVLKLSGDSISLIDSIKIPIPVYSIIHQDGSPDVYLGFNKNTLVFGFKNLDTIIVIKNFRIENDKCYYDNIKTIKGSSEHFNIYDNKLVSYYYYANLPNGKFQYVRARYSEGWLGEFVYNNNSNLWYRLIVVPSTELPDSSDIYECLFSYRDMVIQVYDNNFKKLGEYKINNKGKFYNSIFGVSKDGIYFMEGKCNNNDKKYNMYLIKLR